MATLIQYGQIGKPVKMKNLPMASADYEGVLALVNDILYRCVWVDEGYTWVIIDNTPTLEMPQIRFVSKTGGDYPFSLTVEIVGGGPLQVGDTLQVCGRRTFGKTKKTKRKQKLRRFAEYVITEEDLDKRFLKVSVSDTRNARAHLFHNNQSGGGTLSAIYLRIRRPKGELQGNNTGMTVDAAFSNVVTLWKTYGEDEDDNGHKLRTVNIH